MGGTYLLHKMQVDETYSTENNCSRKRELNCMSNKQDEGFRSKDIQISLLLHVIAFPL